MTTQIDLSNRALLSIGARTTISSFPPADNSIEAQSCAILWQPTFEQLARTSQWNCLRKEVNLTLYQAAQGTPENVNGNTYMQPPQPWLYSYIYPSDCLKAWWLVPSGPVQTNDGTSQTTINNAAGSWLPTGGQIPYAVSSATDNTGAPIRIILTNQTQAILVYAVNQPDPDQWDPLFQQGFVGALGAYLCPALSLSVPIMQMSIRTAEAAINQAKAQDGNEGVTTLDHLPDWISARAGAQGYGLSPYGFTSWGSQQFETGGWLGLYSN